jgi:ectoine hydroxylase-related dioxygenase (phytanoyl-CoA dioxygenase family)
MTNKPLSEEQIAKYFREGYIVVPGLVPAESVQQAVDAFTAPIEGKNWISSIFDHQNPDANPAQHRMLVEPNIVAAVEQIFDVPARVYYGMTAVVPANGGNGLPWHQDNQYDQILGHALNTFVALCDITPDKAILWVAPGTHKLGTQPSKEAEGLGGHREATVEPEGGFPLPGLKAGDVVIFDRNTYHRSLKNETDENRFAYAAQYMAENSRLARTGAKDPIKMPARELQQRWQAVMGT